MKKTRILGATVAAFSVVAVLTRCGGDGATDPGTEPYEFPLAVGNQWVYEVTSTAEKASVAPDTTTVVGTATEGGDLWYIFVDHSDGESTLVRQKGNVVYVEPPTPEFESENALTTYLLRVIQESRPWKFADFDAAAGASWTLIDAETTFVTTVEDQQYEVTFDVDYWAACRGLTDVTAQSGTYSDAYKGEVHQRMVITFPSGADTTTTDMTFWAEM